MIFLKECYWNFNTSTNTDIMSFSQALSGYTKRHNISDVVCNCQFKIIKGDLLNEQSEK